MNTLRQHMIDMHPLQRYERLARSNKDLQRQHSRIHHRRYCSHVHEEDNAGNLAGPGSDRRRPSGWLTGLGVIMRQVGHRVPRSGLRAGESEDWSTARSYKITEAGE